MKESVQQGGGHDLAGGEHFGQSLMVLLVGIRLVPFSERALTVCQ